MTTHGASDEAQAIAALAIELARVGAAFHARGWVPATSGNFSARLPNGFAVTASGLRKGDLRGDFLLRLDDKGRPWGGLHPEAGARRPSAETALHASLYQRQATTGAVLHTHSAHATVLSMHHERCLELSGYEVLKAFPGVESHLHTLRIPIFANDQDMERLAAVVSGALDAEPAAPGFLIRGHGLYAWGRAVSDAVRHVEAFEFLFECEALSRQISRK